MYINSELGTTDAGELRRAICMRLRYLRRSRRLSQEYVALEAEISPRHYCDIENGRCDLKLETLIRICRGLNISISDLTNIRCIGDGR